MQDVDKVLERYRQRLASADDARRHAEHTIERLRSQLHDLKAQLDAVQQQVTNADVRAQQLADARATNRALELEVQQARTSAPQHAKLQIQKLSNRLHQANNAIRELKREILEHDTTTAQRLTTQLVEAQTANRTLMAELQQAHADVAQLRDSGAENRRLRAELKQAQAQSAHHYRLWQAQQATVAHLRDSLGHK